MVCGGVCNVDLTFIDDIAYGGVVLLFNALCVRLEIINKKVPK